MSPKHERGEGRLGMIFALALIGSAIFAGVKFIPVKISAYEFREFLREEARYAAVRHEDNLVVKRILEKAQDLELPLDQRNLKVQRTKSEMIISASYEQPIDFKITRVNYKFEATERAPLF